MLIILTIFAAILASAIIVFAKRRSSHLLEENQPININAAGFRPLFEPGPEALRAAEQEEISRLAEINEAERNAVREERLAALGDLRLKWQGEPSRKNTIELIYLASQSREGLVFAGVAGEIIKLWKNGQIADLSADDLSQLLESHFWLLPARERTSGVNFSIHKEIEGLRRSAHEDN